MSESAADDLHYNFTFYVTFCVANLFQYCAQISLNLCANMGLLAGKIIASGSIVLEIYQSVYIASSVYTIIHSLN